MAENTNPLEYDKMCLSLKNGISMPAIGLGTFRLANYDLLYKTINYALEAGYRLFDTAPMHSNEKNLGKVFRKLLPEHGLAREDIFITTKMLPSANGKFQSNALDKSLEDLGMEYIDLYLIHFPGSFCYDQKNQRHDELRKESWLSVVSLYDESKVRAIGVSNFTIKDLMNLSEVMVIGPMVNQIEWHPYYYQPEMIQYCCDHNIKIQGYNCFGGLSHGNNELLDDPVVKGVALNYQATAAQVLLVWALQKGVAVIPKASNPYHIQSNKQLRFQLTEDDVKILDKLSANNVKYAWDSIWIA